MTDQHPITPPEGLVLSLRNSAPHGIRDTGVTREIWLINRAYAAGADHELEALLDLADEFLTFKTLYDIRAARRPKPPSLKEQALETLNYPKDFWSEAEVDTIRRALDALPE